MNAVGAGECNGVASFKVVKETTRTTAGRVSVESITSPMPVKYVGLFRITNVESVA